MLTRPIGRPGCRGDTQGAPIGNMTASAAGPALDMIQVTDASCKGCLRSQGGRKVALKDRGELDELL